jgi:hypothetical protein
VFLKRFLSGPGVVLVCWDIRSKSSARRLVNSDCKHSKLSMVRSPNLRKIANESFDAIMVARLRAPGVPVGAGASGRRELAGTCWDSTSVFLLEHDSCIGISVSMNRWQACALLLKDNGWHEVDQEPCDAPGCRVHLAFTAAG